jgi:hypothetical protein
MGYTPLFDTLTKGTLCGRWPDIGLWPIVLSMSDRHGVIDATPAYIAGVTGLGIGDVEACMKRFCEPDPYSRSQDAGGARLVLLDEHRDWGWQVVNHAKYREKARLTSKNNQEVESGQNKFRMEHRTAADRRSPPPTTSHTQTETKTQTEEPTAADAARQLLDADETNFAAFKARYPQRSGNQPWTRARRAISARLDEGDTWEAILAGTQRYAEWCAATGKNGTETVMQAATFCGPDKPFSQLWKLPALKPAYQEPKTTWRPPPDDDEVTHAQ